MNEIKDSDLKNIWHKATSEQLDGYFVKGWHYPDEEEASFLFVLGIQKFLDNDIYAPALYSKEEVVDFNNKAAGFISNIFGVHDYGDADKAKKNKYSPAVMLKMAELVIADMKSRKGVVLDEPSI